MKKSYFYIIMALLLFFSCNNKQDNSFSDRTTTKELYNPSNFIIPDIGGKKVKGQLLYLPVYSNIPSHIDSLGFDNSAFMTIHNTDLRNSLKITKVIYFDNEGYLVKDFIKSGSISLNPLAAKTYYIPHSDKSGTGANFLVEWVADTVINEPLVESIITNLKGGQSVSFLSQGKILRELK